MRKKGILEVLVRSVMSLYEGAKIRIRLDSELLAEFKVSCEDVPSLCAVTFCFFQLW